MSGWLKVANSFKAGEAPWEIESQSSPKSFKAGQAPWEKPKPMLKDEFSEVDTGFNKFMQGAAFGYGDELEGAEQAIIQSLGETFGLRDDDGKSFSEKYTEEREKRRVQLANAGEESPTLSKTAEIAGGLASGLAIGRLMPGVKATTMGGRLKDAAKVGAAYGAVMDPGDEDGINPVQPIERAKNTAIGAGFAVALGGAGELVPAVGTKMTGAAKDMLKRVNSWIAKDKPDAKEIKQAAEALGFKPTAGMLKDSPVVQKLESSLSQSPSLPGMMVRREQRAAARKLQDAAEEITEDASQLTKFEAGEKAKSEITSNVKKRFKASTDDFNDLRQYTKDIPSTQRSVEAVSRNIQKIDEVSTFEDGAAASIAKSVIKVLEKKPSADQIKNLRTMVGKKAEAARRAGDGESQGIWKIYEKLGRLEENTIKRGVLNSARNSDEGNLIASGMLGKLKGAKKSYSEQMSKIEDVGRVTKNRATKSPRSFTESIDDMQSEKVANKFFDLGNNKARRVTKDTFPEAFQTLRKQRLSEIRDKSMVKGELNPSKLIKQIDRLDDEAMKDLFRESVSKSQAMKKVINSFPDKVGPSGTPEGLAYGDWLTLVTRQVTDFGRYGAYKFLSSDVTKNLAKRLNKIPEFKNLAETNPDKFNLVVANFARSLENPSSISKAADNNEPKKGPDRWASDGYNNVLKSASPEQVEKLKRMRKELFGNKKAKSLLSRAQNIKPDSKAMKSILKELDKISEAK